MEFFHVNGQKTGSKKMAGHVLALLEEINSEGTTIVMVTHDHDLARRARRNIHILDGCASDITEISSASVTPLEPKREAISV